MKKFLAGIAAAAIITIPMTSFALESMSKGALKKATGQAGVSIAIDNVIIVQKSMPTTTYWDIDGTSSIGGTIGAANAGLQISYLESADAQKLIVLDGIMDDAKYGTAVLEQNFNIAAYADMTGIASVGVAATGAISDPSNGDMADDRAVYNTTAPAAATDPVLGAVTTAGSYTTGISPLSIDVGTCSALTEGLQYNSATMAGMNMQVAGVVIGLPTLEITTYHTADVKVISIATDATNAGGVNVETSVANSGSTGLAPLAAISNEMIRIEKAGVSQMAILGGRLEIAPH